MGNVQSRQMDGVLRVPAQRRGSTGWNFRYHSTRRREHATIMMHNDRLSIADWLDLLDLQQYEDNLKIYNHVADILELGDSDLQRRGIRDSAHRSKMLSSLVGLQTKRRQSMNIEVSTLPRSMTKRKNSLPPLCLSDASDRFESPTLNRSAMKRHSLAVPRSGREQHITFCDEPESIYEEIDPPKSVSTAHRNSKSAACSETMENGSSSSANGGIQPLVPACSVQASEHQQEALALKKALEWELNLDSRDLRSHAWYHGPLPRLRAEEIVQREGDFLIRDCASQPDNYVLTCRTKTMVLHFVINKILIQPETVYERVQYQFEEDAFDAIPDLITFYVGSGKAISAASGVRIQHPCNRSYPLSFYGHKIVGNQLHTQMLTGLYGSMSTLNSPLNSHGGYQFGNVEQQTPSPMSSPPRSKRDTAPRLPSKKQRSQSLTPAQAIVVSNMKNAEAGSSGDGVILDSGDDESDSGILGNGFREGRRYSNLEKTSSGSICGSPMEPKMPPHLEQLAHKLHGNGFQTIARCTVGDIIGHAKFTTHSLPRPSMNGSRINVPRMSSLARNFSIDSSSFNSSLEGTQIPELSEKAPSPPPKPNRLPTLPRKDACGAAAAIYHTSGSDSGNGSGDSVQSSIPGDICEFSVHRGVIIKNPRFMSNSASSVTLKSLTEFDVIAAEEQLFMLKLPEFKPISKFDYENFNTLLLPLMDNQPLDGDALNTFKIMLLETGPKMLAEHITRIDIGLIIEEPPEDNERNVLDCCGLELLMLPQGKVIRDDLIERTQCIKLMVAVTILTCQTDMDRAELLSKWIQIAVEAKTALGNLFGFSAIMLGLCMQQIQKLDQTWHILRQKYTDSAFTFEAKLRPTLISMNECSNPQAPNTTIPHVLLYAMLKDRSIIDIINISNTTDKSSLYTTCITSWECKADDFGMSINFLHLDSARSFLRSLNLYRKNSKTVLEESNSRLDELLIDAFRTEFHVKFLWGSKGALASSEDRHSKLEKVLALMADRFCSVNNNTSAA